LDRKSEGFCKFVGRRLGCRRRRGHPPATAAICDHPAAARSHNVPTSEARASKFQLRAFSPRGAPPPRRTGPRRAAVSRATGADTGRRRPRVREARRGDGRMDGILKATELAMAGRRRRRADSRRSPPAPRNATPQRPHGGGFWCASPSASMV
jgi:hypothetical protein